MTPEEEEDRAIAADEEAYRRMINPRVDTNTELILAITKPTVRRRHSKFVSRDLAVSNIPKNKLEYVDLIRKYMSVIIDFDFMKLPILADVYNADMKTVLNVLRSIGFEERKLHGTATIRRETASTVIAARKRGKWGLRR